MHLKKYLSIFLIAFAFAVAGCSSSDSSGGISDNDQAPDTDGDGIINDNDLDIDGDGILNKDDTDIDGDGTPNAGDENPNGGPGVTPPTDTDGDGIPDVPCTSADIQWPKAELDTGTRVKIRWTLLPEDCGLTEERNIEVQATAHNSGADPKKQNSNKRRVGQNKTAITIPHNCDWDPDPTMGTNIDSSVAIQYDFSALGEALGDSKSGTAYYTEKVNHQVGVDADNCDIDADPEVVSLEFIVGPADRKLTVNPDGSVTGPGNAAVYAMATAKKVSALSEPTWSSTPAGYMNIYINGGVGKNERITIEPGRSNGKYYVGEEGLEAENFGTWKDLQASKYRDYTVRTNYGPEYEGVASLRDPIKRGGNFVLRLNAARFTLNQYSVN